MNKRNNVLALLAFALFIIGFGLIILATGGVDQERISFGQAVIQCVVGLIILAIAAPIFGWVADQEYRREDELHNGRKN